MLDDDSCIDGHGDSVKLAEAIGALAVKMSASEGATCAATWLEKLTGVPAAEIIAWVNMRAAQRNGAVVPTESGWNWWRGNEIGARYMCVFVRDGWVSGMINMSVEHASKDGQWGGPCHGMPEVSNE